MEVDPFSDVQVDYYWSSISPATNGYSFAWYISLIIGSSNGNVGKDATLFVWPVRGKNSYHLKAFINTHNGKEGGKAT